MMLIYVGFSALFSFTFFYFIKIKYLEIFLVPSSSMQPTLYPGDLVVVAKYKKNEVKKNDIIVFNHPKTNELFIKRILSDKNSEILIIGRNIWVDGKNNYETYKDKDVGIVDYDGYQIMLTQKSGSLAKSGLWKINSNEYFVLGDYRDESSDSRTWGAVNKSLVVGKAVCVIRLGDMTCNL